MNVLDDAQDAIRVRGQAYGRPRVNFARIASLLNIMLEAKLSAPLDEQDVAMIGICTKLGRLLQTPLHYDSLVDIAGYAHAYWAALGTQEADCLACGKTLVSDSGDVPAVCSVCYL